MTYARPKTQPTASHYINGQYLEDTAGDAIKVIYPATGEEIAHLHAATPDVVEAALASAQAGQKVWAAYTGAERGRILHRAAQIIRDRNEDLSVLETLDTGKPIQETLVADAASGAEALEYFAGLAATINGEHIPLGADFAYTVRDPLGVCVGIGAWNYPTQIACWKAAPALACGNALVFKPSEITPLCTLKIAEIFTEAGVPDGVFNVVQGYGAVGSALVTDPRVAKVSLTGSVPTGRKVYAAAAADMKHVTMELGGKSPLIIFEDADIENAVSAAINANFYSSGQICSNGTRVFVHKTIKQAFLDRLTARLDGVVMGDPLDPETNMGPLVSQAQLDKVMSYVQMGQDEGATMVAGGTPPTSAAGTYMDPVVFSDVTDGMTIAREEIFGPVLSLLSFSDEEEVISRANHTEFGLSAAVFTKDLARAHRVIGRLQAGTCWINTYNLTPVEMPFGGVKQSGLGRENSQAALDHYTQLKTVYVSMGDVEAAF